MEQVAQNRKIDNSIPKIIHYCWFGKNPHTELQEKCMASWKKYCPDYEIKEWNEDTFDLENAPVFAKQAYEAKRFAFVADFVRLWALIEQGGFYLDTDVELVKPLDDLRSYEAITGFETRQNVQSGFIACKRGGYLF